MNMEHEITQIANNIKDREDHDAVNILGNEWLPRIDIPLKSGKCCV